MNRETVGSAAWWQQAVEDAETVVAQRRRNRASAVDIKNAERTLELRREALCRAKEKEEESA